MQDKARYSECEKLLLEGRYKEAFLLANDISDPACRAAILIDAGYQLKKPNALREGIRLFEETLNETVSRETMLSRSSVLYNIANGYSSLYSLRKAKRRAYPVPPNDDDLRLAKIKYRQALSALHKETPSYRTKLWVNYGNCLSQLGREIEAIDCYRRALDEDPENGMASGNLGVGLYHVTRIMGKYKHDYILAAHQAISAALGNRMHLRYGTASAKATFVKTKSELDNIIKAHRGTLSPSKQTEAIFRRKPTQRYVSFCRDNSLFLNAWVGDKSMAPAISDEIHFGPILTSINDNETVPELLRVLNEIKESYCTARYLYYESLNTSPTLDDTSKLTLYFHTNDMTDLHGLYIGILKSAYARAFDVLDKVARVINIYFGIGRREDSFWNVLAARQSRGQERQIRFAVRPQVISFNNYSLYALADICLDYFESENVDLKTIDSMRNRITHDYLTILSECNAPNNIKTAISRAEMKDKTLSVLLLAKYATLYAVSAINIAEFQKRSGDSVPTIYYRNFPGLTTVD